MFDQKVYLSATLLNLYNKGLNLVNIITLDVNLENMYEMGHIQWSVDNDKHKMFIKYEQ